MAANNNIFHNIRIDSIQQFVLLLLFCSDLYPVFLCVCVVISVQCILRCRHLSKVLSAIGRGGGRAGDSSNIKGNLPENLLFYIFFVNYIELLVSGKKRKLSPINIVNYRRSGISSFNMLVAYLTRTRSFIQELCWCEYDETGI